MAVFLDCNTKKRVVQYVIIICMTLRLVFVVRITEGDGEFGWFTRRGNYWSTFSVFLWSMVDFFSFIGKYNRKLKYISEMIVIYSREKMEKSVIKIFCFPLNLKHQVKILIMIKKYFYFFMT